MDNPPLQQDKGDILVVDDNLPNIRTLSAILVEDGYSVRGARDGETALKIIRAQPPDLILLDIQMPGMDGFTLCQRLKAQPQFSHIPVIFVSALDAVEDKVKGFAVGGIDYVSKPFQAQEVLARVQTHVTLYHLQRQLEERVKERTVEIRRQNQELALINQVIAATAESLSQESILNMVCRELALSLHVPQVTIFLTNQDHTAIDIAAAYHLKKHSTILNEVLQSKADIAEFVQFLLTSKTPQMIENANTDPLLTSVRPLLRQQGVVTLLFIPITIKDALLGGFCFSDIQQRHFLPEEITLAWNVANQVAAALDHARLEAEQQELQAQYQQAQKMEAIGLLASGIAHDFNNLLTVINGFAELIQAEFQPDDPLQDSINHIIKSGQRAARLTRQLLVFSRKQVIEPHILNLNDVAGEMDDMLQHIISEDVEMRLDLTPDLWPVKADPAQIEQIIVNLVVNARDAMPHGGHLTIQLSNAYLTANENGIPFGAKQAEYVLLTVQDTGHGISQTVQARMFEPFFTTKEPGKGTGLGLTTVFGIIKQNQGFIQVESEEGRGTTFQLYWPAVQPSTLVRTADQIETRSPRGMETILIVEDETAVRELIQQALQNWGYHVLAAPDGTQAISLCNQHPSPIHLLLTDLVMPGITGQNLAAQLRELRPNLAVLFMSGYANHAGWEQEQALQKTAFLQKPFSLQDLARKVHEVLDNNRNPARSAGKPH